MKLWLFITILLFLLSAFYIVLLSFVLSSEGKIRKKEKLFGAESDEFARFLQKRMKKAHLPAIKNGILLHLADHYKKSGENKKAVETLHFVAQHTLFFDKASYFDLLLSLSEEREEEKRK